MNKIPKKIIIFVITLLSIPIITRALEVDFPELGGIKPADAFGPAQWISYIFTFSMAAVGLAVIYAFTRGGIEWMTAGDNQSRVSDARARMKGAVLGLIILLGSYVLLNTINPDLVNLREPNFQFNTPANPFDYSQYSGSKTPCTSDSSCSTVSGEKCLKPPNSLMGKCIAVSSPLPLSPSGAPLGGTPTGGVPVGGACNLDNKCINSVCAAANGDLVIFKGVTGTCTMLSINGSKCSKPEDCASNNCTADSGTCQPK